MKKFKTARTLLAEFQTRGLRQTSLLSLLQSLAGTVTFFLSFRLLIRDSGIEAVGLWSLTVGVVAFSRVPDIINGSGLSRLVAMSGEDSHRKISFIDTVTFALCGYYTFVAVVGSYLFPPLIERMVDPAAQQTARELVPWVLASLFSLVLMTAQLNALDGIHRADLRARLMLVGYGLFAISCFVLIPKFGVFGLAVSQIAQQTLCLVWARILLVRHLHGLRIWPSRFSRPELKDVIAFGTKIQATSVPLLVYEPVARILINHFGGLNTLAIYDLAYKLCSYTRLMLESAAIPLVPEFARYHRNDPARALGIYRKATKWTVILTGLTFTSLVVISPVVSLFLLDTVSGPFLLTVCGLSLAWSVAGIGIVPKLYARATGQMRWNIAGEWMIAGMTLLLGALIGLTMHEPTYIFVGPALAVACGNGLALWGNMRLTDTFGKHLKPVV